MFRCSQIARLENRLQHFTCPIAYEDGQYRRRIPHYTDGTAQHGARVIDILQKVMTKNDIERSRLKNVRHLGGVTAFNRDLVTYSGSWIRSGERAARGLLRGLLDPKDPD